MTALPNPPPPARPRVFVTRKLLPATEMRMQCLFDVELNASDRPLSRAVLADAMARCDVLVPTVTDRIDAELIEAAGERLSLITNFGAGTDNIDVAAAHARKILVTNTPGVFTDDTADLTLALIIFVSRRFTAGARVLADGQWQGWAPTNLLGSNLSGKRLGIVGMGRIGQAVAWRAKALGLEVVYHNRHRLPAELETSIGARYEADVDRLIVEADVLTLHCPAMPDGKPLMEARRLALMKPGALLINTGRGQLVDEDALIATLQAGKLGGAGLDVFHDEPHLDSRLLALPNVLILPHLGSATIEGRQAAGERIIANIRSWVDGHRLPDRVLPHD
jgi:glyoxylate reductase